MPDIVLRHTLETNIDLSTVYLAEESILRHHCCISNRFYKMAGYDDDADMDPSGLDDEKMEEDCCAIEDDENAHVRMLVLTQLIMSK